MDKDDRQHFERLEAMFAGLTGRWALAFCGLCALVLLTVASLNYRGLCLSNMAYLPDEQFFRIAIEHVIGNDSGVRVSTRNNSTSFTRIKILRYSDVADFKKHNPRCCEFFNFDYPQDEYEPPDAMDRFFGRAAKTVSVTYVRNYLDEDGARQGTRARTLVTIGNCGRVRR
jgi:hypothetical protein